MKKALKFLMMYAVIFLVSVLIGTFMYTLYMDVIGFISGQKLNFFDMDQIIRALFVVAYSVCILMCPFMNYYRVRHPFGVSQIITFILLTAFTWGFLFPALQFLESKVYEIRPTSTKISHLSGGYFRKTGDKVYYFTRDFYSNPYADDHTNTIIIDTSDDGVVSFEKVKDEPDFELYTAAKPYNEIQAKESFSNNYYDIGLSLRVLVDKGLQCFAFGWTYYLGFISLGLILASLYAFTSMFSWKLINTTFIFMASILILCINTYFYSDVSSKLLTKINGIGFMNWLNNIFDCSAIVVLNVLFSIIFIVIGIVRLVIKNHKAKAEE